MSEKWDDAARRYWHVRKNQPLTKRRDQLLQELGEFMSRDEGRSAMSLLEASKRCVIFCERRSDTLSSRPTILTYFINGNGLRRATRVKNGVVVYDPEGQPLSVMLMVYEICDTIDSAEIMPMLRRELDKIADEAPSP